MLLMIMAVSFTVAIFGCSLIIFGSKTALLLDGADVDENFEVIYPGSSAVAANKLFALKEVLKKTMSSGSKGPDGKNRNRIELIELVSKRKGNSATVDHGALKPDASSSHGNSPTETMPVVEPSQT